MLSLGHVVNKVTTIKYIIASVTNLCLLIWRCPFFLLFAYSSLEG